MMRRDRARASVMSARCNTVSRSPTQLIRPSVWNIGETAILDLETPESPPPPPEIDGEDISNLMDENVDKDQKHSERPSEIFPGE